jgi:CIC family chloride channel protein
VTAGSDAGTGTPTAAAASPRAQRELREFVKLQEQRRRHLPRALLVGVLAGLVAVAFGRALELAEHLRGQVVAWASGLGGAGVVVPIALGAATAAIAVALVTRFSPEASGSGIPHLKAVLHRLRALRWRTILPVKFAGGVIGIGGGLALGREGPSVQMGGAVGQMVGGWFRCTPRERLTLIAAGAGAGLSAAFNAPLAGLVFVLEEVQRDFSPVVFTVTLVASVVADVTGRLLLGGEPVFRLTMPVDPQLASLPLHLVIGVVAAPIGVLFNRSLMKSLDVGVRFDAVPPWLRAAAVGAAIGLVAWLAPSSVGGGRSLVDATLTGGFGLLAILWLLPLRLLLTAASYGTGAAGGIFTPMLVIGALLGSGVGQGAALLLPARLVDLPTCAVVGMAAFFAAVVRAPLTAIVLLVEMTGDYGMVLPLLIACLAAGGIADWLHDPPIYEALLLRDLRRRKEPAELQQPTVLELTVDAGARFDGQPIHALGLPPGCIVISVERGLVSEVPSADFTLAAGDRMSVLVSPRAADAVHLLREGTERAWSHAVPPA